MSLEFITDVIYGLKTDQFGAPMTVSIKSAEAANYSTGARTQTVQSFTIPLVIPLPENSHLQFVKSFGNQQKQGALNLKGRRFLIDKNDIPAGKVINDTNTYVTYRGNNGKVVAVQDYERALDITVSGLPGYVI